MISFPGRKSAHIDPVRNIADRLIFLRKGSCKDHTAGRGIRIRYKSLITLTTPMVIDKDLSCVHWGAANALRYDNWDWPSLGAHMTMYDTNDAI